MTQKLCIAVVGCGFFAQNQLHAWRHLFEAGAELVAVCDTDEHKTVTARKKFGVPALTGRACEPPHWEQAP